MTKYIVKHLCRQTDTLSTMYQDIIPLIFKQGRLQKNIASSLSFISGGNYYFSVELNYLAIHKNGTRLIKDENNIDTCLSKGERVNE